MKNDRFQHGLPDMRYPTPEEVERAIGRARRLRAQALRDALAQGLARAFRKRAPEPAPAEGGVHRAHAG